MTDYQEILIEDNENPIEEPIFIEPIYNKHYIRVDEQNRIIDGFTDAFIQPWQTDICINEYGGYQFRLFPDSEENLIPHNSDSVPLYKWEDGQILPRTPEEIQEDMQPDLETVEATKLTEVDKACTATIHAGTEVELPSGTERFSFKPEDQINLKAAIDEVKAGAAGYPYHADGQLCRIYPAADIIAIGTGLEQHKLYHTTYCNHLNVWIRRAVDMKELEGIVYGVDLPEDLATHIQGVLSDSNIMPVKEGE